MRIPIQRLTLGSRISAAVSARESKNSSSRPFANVPYTRGPILYCEESTWSVRSSRGREMSEPEEGP